MNTRASIYRNAMEPLAIEEIERQMQQLHPDVASLINKADAIAYALNRLPPLYATTEEGWKWQQERARENQQHHICQAASWGLRAAQRQRRGFYTWLQTKITRKETVYEQALYNEFEPMQELKKLLDLLAG